MSPYYRPYPWARMGGERDLGIRCLRCCQWAYEVPVFSNYKEQKKYLADMLAIHARHCDGSK